MRENAFQTGQLLVAVYRNHPYPDIEICYKSILQGVDFEKVSVIFPANESDSAIGDVLLVYLICQKEATVIDAVEKISSHPHVGYAEPNFFIKHHIIPNDQYYEYLWGFKNIKTASAWEYTTGSSGVVVGVTDSGIDYNHPDIVENMWVSKDETYGWNFNDNSGNTMDFTGHGTHVAGTIGAVGNNYIGITGVCWNVKIASLKIGDKLFSTSAVIGSINFANENNIQILNNSWGTSQPSSILKHVIEHYNGLFVASAGNYGANSDIYPDYPGAYDSDNIISVAAANPYNNLTSFSNYGVTAVDIAAPGIDILSLDTNGGYTPQSGTSMAAPHVAGAAALLKSYMPELSPLEIKSIILQSSEPHRALYGKILTGGILDLDAMFRLARQ